MVGLKPAGHPDSGQAPHSVVQPAWRGHIGRQFDGLLLLLATMTLLLLLSTFTS